MTTALVIIGFAISFVSGYIVGIKVFIEKRHKPLLRDMKVVLDLNDEILRLFTSLREALDKPKKARKTKKTEYGDKGDN